MEQEKELQIKRKLARSPRLVKKMVKIYNKMCSPCRALLRPVALSGRTRPMEDYCEDCQKMMREMLE